MAEISEMDLGTAYKDELCPKLKKRPFKGQTVLLEGLNERNLLKIQ